MLSKRKHAMLPMVIQLDKKHLESRVSHDVTGTVHSVLRNESTMSNCTDNHFAFILNKFNCSPSNLLIFGGGDGGVQTLCSSIFCHQWA